MTAIKQFIEDAIKGGWNDPILLTEPIFAVRQFGKETATRLVHAKILLDPLAWQAVGKTRQWEEPKECLIDGEEGYHSTDYQCEAIGFFQDIMSGKSIEEALTAIE
jgi:hypothetical protein